VTTPTSCPSCGAALTGAPRCASCGLPLTGPLAFRLWQVDHQLLTLAQQRSALEAERASLLDRLRAGETGPPVAPPVLLPQPAWSEAPPRKESSPQQVQNTLLTLGAVLLAGAGIVFTAVTYRHLGVVGRAMVLLTLTAAAGWAPTLLLRRGLTASAESVAAVGVVLSLLDAYALRRAGLGDDVQSSSYWCGATTVLAAAFGAYGSVVPVRVARWAGASAAQLPLPFLLTRLDASASAASALLAVQAGADLAVAHRLRLPQDLRRLVQGFGGLFVLMSMSAGAGAVSDGQRAAWVGFAVLAGLAAAASWQATSTSGLDVLALSVVPLLAVAAWAGARPDLTTPQEPLVLVAVAVLGLQVVALLPRDRRLGAAGGALAVSAVSVLVEAEAVLQALIGPFTWLADPWTRTADSARHALALDRSFDWSGTVVTLVVLAGAALAVITAGLVLDRVVPSLVPAGALLVLTGVTLPLGFATSYRDALVLLLLVAGVLCTAGLALLPRLRLVALALVTSGVSTALLAAAWSTADRSSTLTVLAVVAALCAGLSLAVPGVLTGLALVVGAGELAAVGADQGLAADQVGGLLLAAVAVCALLALVLRDQNHRLGTEVAGASTAIAAIACAAGDPGWLSWTLAGSGLAALVVSVRPDRRPVGLLGGLLLSASSWVRLADAGVKAPEPYVAPLAAAALVAGWFRRRSHPTASSWEAYGTALSLALFPSLLRSFADATPARGLLLLVACVSLVLIGAATRQQAPLALGAVVGAVDAVWLLAPYANALPRWLLLGSFGLLLVLVGATYEARLRDVRRLRERYDALT